MTAPVNPNVMHIDLAVTLYEQMILEAVIEDYQVSVRGLMFAYEQALRNRYPYKEIK